MRVKKKGKVDRSTPVNIKALQVSDDDCFGKEWEATNKMCVECSMYDECMVYQLSKGNQKTINKVKELSGNFFDEINWDLVPFDDITKMIEKHPNQLTIQNLREVVKDKSKCIDDKTVAIKVNNYLISEGIVITEGKLSKV